LPCSSTSSKCRDDSGRDEAGHDDQGSDLTYGRSLDAAGVKYKFAA
jgi:hypothetical protein